MGSTSRKISIAVFIIMAVGSALALAQEPVPAEPAQDQRTAESGPSRTQLIFQVEGFSFNGQTGFMSTDEAVPGFTMTRYKAVIPVGGSILIRRLLTPSGAASFVFGVRYIPMSLELHEAGDVFGTLAVAPLLFCAGIEFAIANSPNGNGNYAFIEAAGGPAKISFTNGPVLEPLGAPYGVRYSVAVRNATLLEANAGVRTIIYPLVLTLGVGYFSIPGGVKTTWSASGPGGTLRLDELDRFNADGVKIFAAFGFKFGL
jgi:hypothetical protein